ncbi:12638_t:CDS:2, partial [Funneliformis geosporum]
MARKLSELFHSSQGCENLDVDVHFEEILDMHDPDDYEVVSQSQLVISRQAFRNNASKYFMQDRLGNLGVIDNKYAVAISTACPALNNIVVDSVKVEQTCVEHLKKNNLAFGKTRWCVMTLDGELIDKSVTMSGGNAQVLKAKLEVQWRKFNEKLSSLESQLQEKNDELPELEFELSKSEMYADACVKNITDNETSIVEKKPKMQPNSNILKEYKLRQKDFEEITFKRNECWNNISNLSGGEK